MGRPHIAGVLVCRRNEDCKTVRASKHLGLLRTSTTFGVEGSDKLHASYRIGVLSTLVSNAVVIHIVVNRDDVIHFHFLLFCAGVRGLHKLASLMSFGSAEILIHPSHRQKERVNLMMNTLTNGFYKIEP